VGYFCIIWNLKIFVSSLNLLSAEIFAIFEIIFANKNKYADPC